MKESYYRTRLVRPFAGAYRDNTTVGERFYGPQAPPAGGLVGFFLCPKKPLKYLLFQPKK